MAEPQLQPGQAEQPLLPAAARQRCRLAGLRGQLEEFRRCTLGLLELAYCSLYPPLHRL